jgi:hypothetical protein
MARLQFTDEEFDRVLLKAQELYHSVGQIRCPYFREPVQFNAAGLDHLRRQAWNRGRSRPDQFMRLKYLWAAPEIVRLSQTVQGVWKTQERIRRRRHGQWEEVFTPVTFYEFVAVFEDRRFKVVVKEPTGQAKMFWSIIPFWRQNEQGERVIHEGDPAQD